MTQEPLSLSHLEKEDKVTMLHRQEGTMAVLCIFIPRPEQHFYSRGYCPIGY